MASFPSRAAVPATDAGKKYGVNQAAVPVVVPKGIRLLSAEDALGAAEADADALDY